MVEIFTGSGLGLARSSASILGGAGTLGGAATGTSGTGLAVNATTGNLVAQVGGETLTAVGDSVELDATIGQTYNSLALAGTSGNTLAIQGATVFSLNGTQNTAGSTIQRLGWDGSIVTYSWSASFLNTDGTSGAYVAKEGAGPDDSITYGTITLRSGQQQSGWMWHDGASDVTEFYGSLSQLAQLRIDTNKNQLSYTYDSSGKLVSAQDLAGESVALTYSPSGNLIQIVTHMSGGATLTRTNYSYDISNRLTGVTVDLSPSDNSTSDGKTYTTTFAYSSNTNLISSVTQNDGTRVDFTYDASNRVSTITQWVNATTGRVTTMTYGSATITSGSTAISFSGVPLYVGQPISGSGIPAGTTITAVNATAHTATLSVAATASGTVALGATVTDPQGNQTVMISDGNGNLQSIASPAVAGGVAQFRFFGYDTNGNVTSEAVYANVNSAPSGAAITQVTEGGFSDSSKNYDANGNARTSVDLAGDTTTYTYNAFNKVLTRTVYTAATPGSIATTGGETTYYVYDTNGRLGFTISQAGDVTASVVNSLGQTTSTLTYTNVAYNTSGLTPATPPSLSTMTTWQAGLTAAQKQAAQRTDYTYDLRGNLATAISYSANDTSGNGLTTAPYTKTTYVYDQAGELLSKLVNDGSSAETYVYDGLGRITLRTDAAGAQTATAYNDTAHTEAVTYANGLVATSSFDRAGELTSLVDTGTGIATTTSSYVYDADGNLRVATDPAGVNSYYFYDSNGRKTGMVDGDGYLTEYRYDAADRLTATVTYATALTTAQLTSLAPVSGVPSTVPVSAFRPAATASDDWNWTIYNAAGEVSQTINAVGAVTGYTYDGTGAVIQTTHYATALTPSQLKTLINSTPGTNLLYNPTLTNTTAWQAWNPNGIVNAGSPYVLASQSLPVIKVDYTATASGQQASISSSPAPATYALVSGGQQVQIRSGVEATGPIGAIDLHVFWLDGSGNSTWSEVKLSSGTQSFNTQFAGILTAPAGTVGMRVELTVTTTGAGSGSFDLSNPQITVVGPALAPVTVTANSAADSTVRSFYNADGLLVGSLDARGYLTQIDYDAAGRKIDTIAYATQASSALWATGTFAQLQASVGTSAKDHHSYWLYDDRGLLVDTIDPVGNVTTYSYSASGEVLTRTTGQQVTASTAYTLATLPAAAGALETTVYTYDGDGRVLTQAVYANNSGVLAATPIIQVTNTYDSRGNLLTSVDLAGDTTTYTYNALNLMLTRTVYTTAAQGSTAASGAETTFYVYDADGRLRFTVSPAGDVTARVLDGMGRVTATLDYPTAPYPMTGLSASTPISLSTMTTWQAGLTAAQKQAIERTDYTYDLNGNVATATAYSATDTSGNGVTTSARTITTYTYDAAGELISKLVNDGTSVAQTFTYDGLGRVITQRDGAGNTTTFAYSNSASSKTATYANGLVDTTVYNAFGNTASVTDTGPGIATTTSSYVYDADGNLRVATDPAGVNTYYFYDSYGRKTGMVDGDGYLTAYKYDAADRLTATVTYATALTAAQLATLAPASGVPSATTQTAIQPIANASDTWNWTVYDAAGRVAQTINAIGSVTAYTYDGTGAVIQQTTYANKLSAAQLASLIENTPGQNVLYNPGFNGATPTSGWQVWNGNSIITGGPVTGTSQNLDYIQASYTATTSAQTADIDSDVVRFAAAPGQVFNVQAGVAGTGPVGSLHLVVSWFNSSGTYLSDSSVSAFLNGPQAFNTQSSGSVTAVAGAAYGNIHLYLSTSGAGSGTFTLIEPKVTIANATLAPVTVTANSAADSTVRSFYNADGLLVGSLDARGYLTQIDYDAAGRKIDTIAYATQASSALWATGTFAQLQASVGTSANDHHSYWLYDDRGLLVDTIDPVGNVTTYSYSASGEVLTRTKGQQVTPSTTYTLATLPAATGTLETTVYTYDGDGRVKSETLGSGTAQASTTSYTYDAAGNVLTVTNGNSFVTTSTYDALGRVLTMSQVVDGNSADNITAAYTYDTRGNKTSQTDARGNTSYFYYDSDSRLVLSVDANGYATATSYNAIGKIASLIHYAAPVTGTWNATTRPTIVTGSSDATTSFGYDAAGHLTSTTDALGNTESYSVDAFGNRVSTTSKLGAVTLSYYDTAGNLLRQVTQAPTATSSVASSYNVTAYAYDAFGNVSTKVEGYASANTASATITALRSTSYLYDADNRLTKQSLSLGSGNTADTVYQYDAYGNVVLLTDPNLNKTYSYYDVLNRKIAQVDALGVLTTYAYDADSNLTAQITYATPLASVAVGVLPTQTGASRQTTYTYDGADRRIRTAVANVTTGTWNGSSYSQSTGTLTASQTVYDGNGNVIETIDGNGKAAYNYYDANNNKIAQVDADGYLTTYTYDANGNVTQENAFANAVNTQTGATVTLGTTTSVAALVASAGYNLQDRITQFTYDKNGHRLTESRLNVLTWTQGTGDALVYVGPNPHGNNDGAGTTSTITYTYNALGEVLTKQEATGDTTTYTYDNLGRMATSLTAMGEKTAETYDALGNVTQSASSPTTGASGATRITTYTYDAAGRIASMIGPGINASETAQVTTYAYDNNGNVTSQTITTNTAIVDGQYSTATTYDKLNRAIATVQSYWNGSAWVAGDTQGVIYNAFGQVAATTVNGTRTTQFLYDNAGHLIASNSGDGTWKAFVTDGNGNATLTIQSAGTQDLAAFLNVQQSVSGTTTIDTSTYNQSGALALATANNTRAANLATNTTITTVAGSSSVSFSGTALVVGQAISGAGIPAGAIVQSVSGSTATLSNSGGTAVTATATGTFTIGVLTTVNVYDQRNQMLQTIAPQRQIDSTGTFYTITSSEAYNAFGDVVGQTDARGNTTQYAFNTLGKQTAQIAPQVAIAGSFLYVGQAINGTGIASGTTIATISQSAGTATLSTAATASGTIVVGGLQITTTSGSTAITFTAATGNPTTYAYYDISGREIAMRDADGNLITQVFAAGTGYNGSQALATTIYHPDGGVLHNTFDVYGDALTQTDALGNVTTNTYDNSGNLIQVNHPVIASSTITLTNGSTTATYNGGLLYAGMTLSGNGIAANTIILSISGNTLTLNNAATASGTLPVNNQLINYYSYDDRGERVSESNNVQSNPVYTGSQVTFAGGNPNGTVTFTITLPTNSNTGSGPIILVPINSSGVLSGTVSNGVLTLNVSDSGGGTPATFVLTQNGNVLYQGQETTVTGYGAQGQVHTHTSGFVQAATWAPAAQTTAYDAQGRVISTTDYLGNTINYAYQWETSQGTNGLANNGGWTKTTSDVSAGVTSSSTTDVFGRQIGEIDDGGDVYTFTYNKAGELIGQTNTAPTLTITTVSGSSTVSYTGGTPWVGEQVTGTGIPTGTTIVSVSATNATSGTMMLSASATASGTVVALLNQTQNVNGTITAVSTSGQNLAYTYYNTGKVASITDLTSAYSSYYNTTLKSVFAYDVNGNRTLTNYTSVAAESYSFYGYLVTLPTTTVLENATATYDALNRVSSITDPGSSTRPSYTQTKSYDANGNVIENKTVHQNLSTTQTVSGSATDDYWYAYDSMNRVVISQGAPSDDSATPGSFTVTAVSNTLQLVAEAVYDDGGQWAAIAAANGLTSDTATTVLTTGTVLKIPTAVDPGTSDTSTNSDVWARTNLTGGIALTYNAAGQEMTSTTIDMAPNGSGGSFAQVTQNDYSYSADGQLITVSVGQSTVTAPNLVTSFVTQAAYTRDALGRILTQNEYDTSANDDKTGLSGATGNVINSTAYTYDFDSHVLTEQTVAVQYNVSTSAATDSVTTTYFDYGTANAAGTGYIQGTSYADGNVIYESSSTNVYNGTTSNGSLSSQQSLGSTITYLWTSSAQQSVITNSYTTYVGGNGSNSTTTSTFSYDHNGNVTQDAVTGAGARTNYYTTTAAGMIMTSQEVSSSAGTSAPETFYYYFNDQLIGQIGNNGGTPIALTTGSTNYTSSIEDYSSAVSDQTMTSNGTGPFVGNNNGGIAAANFDENFNPISPTGNGSSPAAATYTVQNGQTLQSIAAAVYGDANLWYVIAGANGLTASSALAAGTVLSLPNTVQNAGNTASTFKPYNASVALGDVQPGAPIPQQDGGCGILGEIIVAVIAVAIQFIPGVNAAFDGLNSFLGGVFSATSNVVADTLADVVTGVIQGAVTSFVSQGVGVAIGAQSGISWSGVALGAIGGGVGGGLSNVPFLNSAASGSTAGIEQAFARGVISSTVTQGIGVATGLQANFDWAGVAASGVSAGVGEFARRALHIAPIGPGDHSIGDYVKNVGVSSAQLFADAAVRSVIKGTDFGDNVLAALPDTIANTVGNFLKYGVSGDSGSSTSVGGFQIDLDKFNADTSASLNAQSAQMAAEIEKQFASENAAQNAAMEQALAATAPTGFSRATVTVGPGYSSVPGSVAGSSQLSSYDGMIINNNSASALNTVDYLMSDRPESNKIDFIVKLEQGKFNDGVPGSGLVADQIAYHMSGYLREGGISADNSWRQLEEMGHLLEEANASLGGDDLLKNSISKFEAFKWKVDDVRIRLDDKPLGDGGGLGFLEDVVATAGFGLIERAGVGFAEGITEAASSRVLAEDAVQVMPELTVNSQLPALNYVGDSTVNDITRTVRGAASDYATTNVDRATLDIFGHEVPRAVADDLSAIDQSALRAGQTIDPAADSELPLTAGQLRGAPGVATASGDLAPASGRWLDPGVPTPIPGQVADALVGRNFNSFNDLRSAIWQEIGGNAELNGGFSRGNLGQMNAGNAPFAPSEYLADSGAFGERFNLHHIDPIANGGPVYDLSNLQIVSPKVHYSIHYGPGL